MRKLQRQGVHHVTLVGADRQTSISFKDPIEQLTVGSRGSLSRDRTPKDPHADGRAG